MESVFKSVAQLSEDFNKRMLEFEAKLQKDTSPPDSISGLTAEFTAFKIFTTQALNNLQGQLEIITRNMDNLEMRGRRKILLLHGVTENKNENPTEVVLDIIKHKFKLNDLSIENIKRCQRLGRSASIQKARPLLFKMQDVQVRDKIWFSKAKLKGSGITLSEFLTKSRHDVFMVAREKMGVKNCWTKEGNIYIITPDGKHQRVTSLLDFNKISEVAEKPSVAPKAVSTKSKRAATSKK